ncbi:MAG: histidine kinase dimerization/phosphoacceptor domain -containing protein [Methanobacteriaceae archaeon]|nr:histidine kinase dimerization/phosphoacceptor domain -containing protein [Methanobacteriaceae archaeon]
MFENELNSEYYKKYVCDYLDKHVIILGKKINKVICILTFLLALVNLILTLIPAVSIHPILNILKTSTYNPIFFMLISSFLFVLNEETKEKKYKTIELILLVLSSIYIILILLSCSGIPILSGWGDLYQDSGLFLVIFIMFYINMGLILKKKFLLGQILGLSNFILGYTGFLFYSPGNTPTISLALNYLLFIVTLSIIFVNIRPKHGLTRIFYLKTTGSVFARSTIIVIPIFLIIGIFIIYGNTTLTSLDNKGSIVAGVTVLLLILILVSSTRKFTESDIFGEITHQQLCENKKFFEEIITEMDDGVIVTDKDDIVIYLNDYFDRYKIRYDTLLHYDIKTLTPYYEQLENEFIQMKKIKKSTFIDSITVNQNEKEIYLSGWCTPRFENNEYIGSIIALVDMTFEKEKESSLKQSIKDKNIMLAEVHHRVKNNLQIINSLISLKSRKIEDQYTLDIIKEIENRIKSMGLIHEQLYQQETFSTIDIQKYVKSLTSQIKNSFMGENIKFE